MTFNRGYGEDETTNRPLADPCRPSWPATTRVRSGGDPASIMSDDPDDDDAVRYEPETNTYHVQFDPEHDRPSLALVMAVSTITGREPDDLPLLQGVVSPEALDDLFAATERGYQRDGGRVEFEYHDFDVTVYGDGRIEVQSRDGPAGDDSTEADPSRDDSEVDHEEG